MPRPSTAAAFVAAGLVAAALPPRAAAWDVVIYGATPAGMSAAITASKNGTYSVALVEPLPVISGMGAAGGLGLNDQRESTVSLLSGLALQWARRNAKYYYPDGNGSELVLVPDMWLGQRTWEAMVSEAKVSVFVSCPMASAARSGTTITSFTAACASGATTFSAPMFIDASYDGELLIAAGLSHAYGREAASQYGESLAGVQTNVDNGENFNGLVISATFDNGTLIPYISHDELLPIGSGDDKIMAFQHRACITVDTDNQTPFPKPPGYNPEDFTLLQRTLDAEVASKRYPDGPPITWFTSSGSYSPAVTAQGRHKNIVCCGGGPVISDAPDLNRGWVTANWTERRRIIDAHTYYLQGSFYYMANDPRVPSATKADVSRFGLCKDEWVGNGNWPVQLYVREGARLVGDRVITQDTLCHPQAKSDSVGVGVWELDKHITSRYAVKNATTGKLYAVNEGYFRASPTDYKACGDHGNCTIAGIWYDMPYSALLPKRVECTNLLVPVALSASSVVYSSTRIETMFMALGAAAANAALMVVAAGGPGSLAVQDVSVPLVQAAQLAQGWFVHGPPNI